MQNYLYLLISFLVVAIAIIGKYHFFPKQFYSTESVETIDAKKCFVSEDWITLHAIDDRGKSYTQCRRIKNIREYMKFLKNNINNPLTITFVEKKFYHQKKSNIFIAYIKVPSS
jgi:hypothetical protein